MDAHDADLVKLALAGDKAAFGRLVARHRPAMQRLAGRMLGDGLDAEDAVQEACLQAYLGLGRLRRPERFAAWLYGITVNVCRMRLRARRAAYRWEDWDGGRAARDLAWPAAQASAESVYETRALHAAVQQAIAALPPDQQAAVRWHYLDGLTIREISALAGSPVGTIKARLHRARGRLRQALARELAAAGTDLPREKSHMIEVIVKDVLISVPKTEAEAGEGPAAEAQPKHYVVVLQTREGERVVPIWIGPHEGQMMSLQLAGSSAPRPLTYDLMAKLLEVSQTAVESVQVNRLHEEVFYATVLVRAGGQTQTLDARPSDALNLAMRLGAPIFVDESVLQAVGVPAEGLTEELLARAEEHAAAVEWISAPPPQIVARHERKGE